MLCWLRHILRINNSCNYISLYSDRYRSISFCETPDEAIRSALCCSIISNNVYTRACKQNNKPNIFSFGSYHGCNNTAFAVSNQANMFISTSVLVFKYSIPASTSFAKSADVDLLKSPVVLPISLSSTLKTAIPCLVR